jgi:hypothetical protein
VRGVAAAVLTFEAIVILLAIPVAVAVGDLEATVAVPVGLALALLALVAAGGLGRGWGYRLGWAVQGFALILAVLAPGGTAVRVSFALMALLFGGLWFLALRLGRQIEAAQAARAQEDGPPGEPDPAP